MRHGESLEEKPNMFITWVEYPHPWTTSPLKSYKQRKGRRSRSIKNSSPLHSDSSNDNERCPEPLSNTCLPPGQGGWAHFGEALHKMKKLKLKLVGGFNQEEKKHVNFCHHFPNVRGCSPIWEKKAQVVKLNEIFPRDWGVSTTKLVKYISFTTASWKMFTSTFNNLGHPNSLASFRNSRRSDTSVVLALGIFSLRPGYFTVFFHGAKKWRPGSLGYPLVN